MVDITATIAVIEDDPGVRFFLEEAMKVEGYVPVSFVAYEDAVPHLPSVDLIIIDIKLPGMDGLSAVEEIRSRLDTPIIVITAFGTRKNALKALEIGATDFFVKPIVLDEMRIVIRRALARRTLAKELAKVREEVLTGDVFHGVVGRSEQMKDLFRQADKVAPNDLTVLITGETGVGKEELAKLVHVLSKRKGPFVAVNCASIPDNLLESELFGHEKGAFTGAFQQKPGKFEIADKGTLVLDEIGEMSPYLQAKLLRAIETKEVERLGGVHKRHVDARIVATTNRVIENEIKEGKFREDLFFRLAQIHLEIAPLRERTDDIEAFTEFFLVNLARDSRGALPTIDRDARSCILRYRWPGNVRELYNALRRALAMCENNVITVDDLPLHIRGDSPLDMQQYQDKTLDEAISVFEKVLIEDALAKTRGSQAKAAKLLGISERSMWYRVKKYDITAKL